MKLPWLSGRVSHDLSEVHFYFRMPKKLREGQMLMEYEPCSLTDSQQYAAKRLESVKNYHCVLRFIAKRESAEEVCSVSKGQAPDICARTKVEIGFGCKTYACDEDGTRYANKPVVPYDLWVIGIVRNDEAIRIRCLRRKVCINTTYWLGVLVRV